MGSPSDFPLCTQEVGFFFQPHSPTASNCCTKPFTAAIKIKVFTAIICKHIGNKYERVNTVDYKGRRALWPWQHSWASAVTDKTLPGLPCYPSCNIVSPCLCAQGVKLKVAMSLIVFGYIRIIIKHFRWGRNIKVHLKSIVPWGGFIEFSELNTSFILRISCWITAWIK